METSPNLSRPRAPHLWPVALALAGGLIAQCDPQFAPLLQRATVDGAILCSQLWDPDGPGPLTELLVVGGTFTVAGGVAANNLAVYDFATASWSALGTGLRVATQWPSTPWLPSGAGSVTALAVAPDHSLLVVGSFTHAGDTLARNVARWNGSAWSPLGLGVDGTVQAIASAPNGDLIVGGSMGAYTIASASEFNSIAKTKILVANGPAIVSRSDQGKQGPHFAEGRTTGRDGRIARRD